MTAMSPSNNENGFITFVGAAHCGRPVREPAVGLPYCGKSHFYSGCSKMPRYKLSLAKSRSRGRPKSFVGNGLKPFPTGVHRNKLAPCLTRGRMSLPAGRQGEHRRWAFFSSLLKLDLDDRLLPQRAEKLLKRLLHLLCLIVRFDLLLNLLKRKGSFSFPIEGFNNMKT